MKFKNIKTNVTLTIMLLNLMILFENTVYASENKVIVSLPVKQVFEVQNVAPDNLNQAGTYELTGLSQDTPMPNSSRNGIYVFTINGSNDKTVIPFTYTRVGVYQYKLLQTTKDAENYIYDRTGYTITVYIKNSETGKLISEVIVENGSGNKTFLVQKYIYSGAILCFCYIIIQVAVIILQPVHVKAVQGDSGHSQVDRVTDVYSPYY